MDSIRVKDSISGTGESELVFPCTSLVYSLVALCSFLIYILFFTDQKKKKWLAKVLANRLSWC